RRGRRRPPAPDPLSPPSTRQRAARGSWILLLVAALAAGPSPDERDRADDGSGHDDQEPTQPKVLTAPSSWTSAPFAVRSPGGAAGAAVDAGSIAVIDLVPALFYDQSASSMGAVAPRVCAVPIRRSGDQARAPRPGRNAPPPFRF